MDRKRLQADSDSALKMGADDLEMSELEYQRPLGAYKPRFQGIPDDYYPASWCEVALCVSLVFFVMGAMLGLLIGFFVLDDKWGSTNFVLLFSIILVVFSAVLLVLIYWGGKTKIHNQRKLIQERIRLMRREG